jgi:hypothetical protein
MLFRRLLVIICPALLFLGLEFLFANISLVTIIIPVLLLIILISLKLLIKSRFFSRDFWEFFILPFLFFITLTSVLFIVDSIWLRHALIIIFAFIFGLYLENIFIFFFRPAQYQADSFENFSAFLNLIVFFLTAINLNAFGIFLNAPLWLVSLILIIVSTLLIFQSFWANQVRSKLKLLYLVILNLMILEFFWCINFLPGNFYVNSTILTILFYFTWEIFREKLMDKFETKSVWRFAIISLTLILLIVITSQWI